MAVQRSFLLNQGTKLSLHELAKIFNVTTTTIKNWAGKAGGQAGKKVYDLKDLARWRVRDLEATIERLKLESGNSAKIRKYEAEARLAELKVAELERSLVGVAEVQQEWTDSVARAKNKLLGLPDRLALEVSQLSDPGAVRDRLMAVVVEALEELSSRLE